MDMANLWVDIKGTYSGWGTMDRFQSSPLEGINDIDELVEFRQL